MTTSIPQCYSAKLTPKGVGFCHAASRSDKPALRFGPQNFAVAQSGTGYLLAQEIHVKSPRQSPRGEWQIDACVNLPRGLYSLLHFYSLAQKQGRTYTPQKRGGVPARSAEGLNLQGVLIAPFRKRVRADAFPLNQYHSPLGSGSRCFICPLWG